MALIDNNTVYYPMEQSTGATRTDVISGLDLTDHNSVAQVAGEHNFGAGFTAASSQYLSHVHNAAFSVDTAQDGFTVGFWFYPTVAGPQGVISKGFLNGGSHLEWQFIQKNPVGEMAFYMSYDGGSVVVAVGAAPTLNAWNYILGWWDKDAATVNIRVNCDAGTGATLSPNTPFVGTGDFNVGRIFNNFAEYGTYRIDELSIWQRLLTSDEQAQLCDGTFWCDPSTGLAISPTDITVVAGQSQDFTTNFDATFAIVEGGDSGTLSDVADQSVKYTAGNTLGTYHLVATNACGWADVTATITVIAAGDDAFLQVKLKGYNSGDSIASGDYGLPTNFLVQNPQENIVYILEQLAVDPNNFFAKKWGMVQLLRNGGASQDTTDDPIGFGFMEIQYETT